MSPFFSRDPHTRTSQSRKLQSRKSQKQLPKRGLRFEPLEDRAVLSTFGVVNLNDAGTGSLRQAIHDANANAGADTIEFEVAGSIKLTSGALPTIIGQVNIDGTTAPGFAGKPLVEIDYSLYEGLMFGAGSDMSQLQSLSLVNSGGNGATFIGAGQMEIVGNYIGIGINEQSIANYGNGLSFVNSSGNTIGGDEIVDGYLAIDRNVISSSKGHGINLQGAYRNTIVGNYIGLDVTGTVDLANLGNGIYLTAGADNVFGGGIVNVISGNEANGVYLTGGSHHNEVAGNYIGTNWSGSTAIGNRLDGVKSDGGNFNLIGNDDPVASIDYYNAANSTSAYAVSGWQGIRGLSEGQYAIVGTSGNNGLLFEGGIDGDGDGYPVNFPGAQNTSVYSAEDLGNGQLRLVGSFKFPDYETAEIKVHGFQYFGTVEDLGLPGGYSLIDHPGSVYNYVHSTDNGLVVGNYDSPVDHGDIDSPFGPGHAFIYDTSTDSFLPDISFPGTASTSAYGIWYNGGTSYTIVGGYSLDPTNNFENQGLPLGTAYMVDFDSATNTFSHWTPFEYPDGENLLTHFQGISSTEKGVYQLAATSAEVGADAPALASWAVVTRKADGSFGTAWWKALDPGTALGVDGMPTADSVYGNQIVGEVIGDTLVSYQATLNLGFQLSNVISGNGGNGISLVASSFTQVAMNNVGTDVTGTVDLGNLGSGILITAGSASNLIGGASSGGNDPTNGTFVRPPLGNLVSGNNAYGVLITGGANNNQLSGNYIGTTASGNAALGNSLDGVAIENANFNALIGCTFEENPFVYYNVISANGGNGLRITNSNDTTVQANFLGMNANNDARLGNVLNGLVVEGNSTRTTVGGAVPLGNVVSANGANGIVVKDSASYFTSYNTFTGLAAFGDARTFGNVLDGMLITSTGGNILIRTCVITRNGDDGIEISGNARDVRVTGVIIGLNTNGTVPMGNLDNGIEIGGNAQDIVIGGPQPTFNLVPQNIISANGNNGVAVTGKAKNITINHGYIGTDIFGIVEHGNSKAGIFLGSGTQLVSIGSADPTLLTLVSGNHGNGIEMRGTNNNTVVGTHIGTDASGEHPVFNRLNGILITDLSNNNTIGGSANGLENFIAFNGGEGVFVQSGSGNAILHSAIYRNTLIGIDLGINANQNQTAPKLISAQQVGGGIQITGQLQSVPNNTFTIELFASDVSEAGGRYFVGTVIVKTDKNGLATFTYNATIPPSGAIYITGTATNSKNNTSEFSNAVSY